MLLMVVVMTVHSFAEGVAVGVSFGGGTALATAITFAIAVHNIPEGLAITAVLRPQRVSLLACAGWSVFSSLPQPIIAVPAYLFVERFAAALPYGLGFAAGAMVFMVLVELLPEAYEQARTGQVAVVTGLTSWGCCSFSSTSDRPPRVDVGNSAHGARDVRRLLCTCGRWGRRRRRTAAPETRPPGHSWSGGLVRIPIHGAGARTSRHPPEAVRAPARDGRAPSPLARVEHRLDVEHRRAVDRLEVGDAQHGRALHGEDAHAVQPDGIRPVGERVPKTPRRPRAGSSRGCTRRTVPVGAVEPRQDEHLLSRHAGPPTRPPPRARTRSAPRACPRSPASAPARARGAATTRGRSAAA